MMCVREVVISNNGVVNEGLKDGGHITCIPEILDSA
jgi:hypothetical protein